MEHQLPERNDPRGPRPAVAATILAARGIAIAKALVRIFVGIVSFVHLESQRVDGVKTSPLICNPSESCCPSLSRELISTDSNFSAIGSFSRSYRNWLTRSIVPDASTRHCTVMYSSESCFNWC